MRPLLLTLLLLTTLPTPATPPTFHVRGVSLAHLHRGDDGYGSDACRQQLAAIRATGATWIAITDFAYMPDVARPHLHFARDAGLSEQHLLQVIRDAHAAGLKVLLKPHIWSRQFHNNHKWHGDIRMTSDADWDAFFSNYRDYLLYTARIARAAKADALCVGVEYEGTLDQGPRWRRLVSDVRAVYPGPLTYAANFMEASKLTWWDALDCIGVNAYFPLADDPNPTDAHLRAGWAKIYADLEALSRKWNRQICLTEIGYSQSAHAAREPWSYDVVNPNPALQARLYRIAMEEAQKRPFVVGAFVWKWFTGENYRRSEPFAIQSAPAVIDALRQAWSHP